MKTPSAHLHSLIKSLTKQEKRYFKLFAQRHTSGKENQYLKLFDAIDAQEVYKEDAIKKKFSKEKFVKQLFTRSEERRVGKECRL